MIVHLIRIPGPNETDTRRFLWTESFIPLRHEVRGAFQVRSVSRNCFKRGLAGQQQAHKWTMEIKVRPGLALCDNRIDPRQGRKQCFQSVLHLKHDFGTFPGNQLRVSTKLQSIAQALLGMDQNGFAGDVFRPQPYRFFEIAFEKCLVLAFSAPFVFLQAKTEVSQPKAQQSLTKMDFRIVRFDRFGPGISGQRLFEAPQFHQHIAAIDQGGDVIRLDCERAVVARQRFFGASQLPKEDSKIVERLMLLRLKGKGLVAVDRRLLDSS